MPRNVARYAVTFGLSGCYMPDSHEGCHEFATRRELAEFIRSEMQFFDIPAYRFAEVGMRRLWRFIARNGSSNAHFRIEDGKGSELTFHGLTADEYNFYRAEEE